MKVGDIVTVLPPFKDAYPDSYVLEAFDDVNDICTIEGDRQFSSKYISTLYSAIYDETKKEILTEKVAGK